MQCARCQGAATGRGHLRHAVRVLLGGAARQCACCHWLQGAARGHLRRAVRVLLVLPWGLLGSVRAAGGLPGGT
jgi:hypothetical protein